ncbi:MAG: hypothetical protein M3N28_03475 [Actinomycetota bacterium]|nr:hypothetical protein [Actinomycetota bacterium]
MADDELDISEEQEHPILTEDEDKEQRGGDPRDPGPRPEEPAFGSDPDLRERLREFVARRERPPRQDELWPFLLVRAFAGDTGVRSPAVGWFWESPDVIVVPGVVDTLEGQVPTLTPRAEQDHTIFVRTWNLGRFPAYSTRVRLWWANPAFAFVPGSAGEPEYVGGAFVDLEDQYHFPGCRAVVRIPVPWNPVVVNGGHECLLAKVECHADRAAPGWEASTQRHVGQRNLNLLLPDDEVEPLLKMLTEAIPWHADVHLLHGMGSVTSLIGAQGPHFAEEFGMGPPPELPSPAYPLEDGQGHLGAVTLEHGDPHFLPGEEAAGLLARTGHQRDPRDPRGQPSDEGSPPGVLAELLRRSLDLDDMSAGAVADRLGGGLAHLLRLVAVHEGRAVGGYSVIVST